jgi:phosphatidylserine/phosphatidylglycerophosphate/cardiolipin synthase-like enzyme
MRKKAKQGPLSVQAIAGTYVVLLGIDLAETAIQGILGFAIERIDHTENERSWLSGFKTFVATDPGKAPGSLVSTRQHPVQAFQWGDYSAKPDHDYTYRIVALGGTPQDLQERHSVEVRLKTEGEAASTHGVYFNRGVAASQAYARRFKNQTPDQVPDRKAWIWLSRGLEEALLAFIAQAKGKRYQLRAALYEFHYPPILAAFKAAAAAGADVKIIFDARENSKNYPNRANRAAIAAAGIEAITLPRTASVSYIAHNKFIVLLYNGKPTQVWTGSTNITEGGIFGHSNVGHRVRDTAIAAAYLGYWQQLQPDPTAAVLRPWCEANSPQPPAVSATKAIFPVFSPRPNLKLMSWYAERMAQAQDAVFVTAAFGVNPQFQAVLEGSNDFLRYLLLEKSNGKIELLKRNPDNRVSVGASAGKNALENFLQEKLTGLNKNVNYIHTKYMLVDPLGKQPLVITGSANFSDPSTTNNDENMLAIFGDSRVADIYLGEFMRLFNHFYIRNLISEARPPLQAAGAEDVTKGGTEGAIEVFPEAAPEAEDPPRDGRRSIHLSPDDSWLQSHYQAGSPKYKERLYFAGTGPQVPGTEAQIPTPPA